MLCFKENICPLLVFGQWETNIILKNKDRLRRQDKDLKQHFEKNLENDKKTQVMTKYIIVCALVIRN